MLRHLGKIPQLLVVHFRTLNWPHHTIFKLVRHSKSLLLNHSFCEEDVYRSLFVFRYDPSVHMLDNLRTNQSEDTSQLSVDNHNVNNGNNVSSGNMHYQCLGSGEMRLHMQNLNLMDIPSDNLSLSSSNQGGVNQMEGPKITTNNKASNKVKKRRFK